MGKRWKMVSAWMAGLGLIVCLASCSQLDAVQAAKTIHAYLPVVMGLAGDAAAIAGTLDPEAASAMGAASTRVQTDLQELETVSGAYATAPSADGWASLGAAVDTLVKEADQGLLAALAIKDAASQAKAKAALSAVDAAVHVLDGYLMAARGPAAGAGLGGAGEGEAAIGGAVLEPGGLAEGGAGVWRGLRPAKLR